MSLLFLMTTTNLEIYSVCSQKTPLLEEIAEYKAITNAMLKCSNKCDSRIWCALKIYYSRLQRKKTRLEIDFQLLQLMPLIKYVPSNACIGQLHTTPPSTNRSVCPQVFFIFTASNIPKTITKLTNTFCSTRVVTLFDIIYHK